MDKHGNCANIDYEEVNMEKHLLKKKLIET